MIQCSVDQGTALRDSLTTARCTAPRRQSERHEGSRQHLRCGRPLDPDGGLHDEDSSLLLLLLRLVQARLVHG